MGVVEVIWFWNAFHCVIQTLVIRYSGFPGGPGGKEPTCQRRRYERLKDSPQGHKESDTAQVTWHAHTIRYLYFVKVYLFA